jgi:hypothetical protein
MFIMAHGFYLTNADSMIDTLRKWFDESPNLYADICCTKWWNRPDPSYPKLRAMLIKYKDRFMFGTDYNTKRPHTYHVFMRERLESNKKLTFGSNGGEGPGLALPLDVINRIYYWNACKLIPGVKERLIALGYEISDTPPAAVPIEPGLDYDPQEIVVIDQADVASFDKPYKIVIDVSEYHGTKEALVDINYFTKTGLTDNTYVKTLHKGPLEGRNEYTWDLKDENGKIVPPGKYRTLFEMDSMRVSDKVFELK